MRWTILLYISFFLIGEAIALRNPHAVAFLRRYSQTNNLKSIQERCYKIGRTTNITRCFDTMEIDLSRLTQSCPPLTSSFPPCQASIITQLSIDRVSRVPYLLGAWDGYVSLSIYVVNIEEEKKILTKLFEDIACLYAHRLTITVVIGRKGARYPINLLRNVAFESSREDIDWVGLYDVDFNPSKGLCQVVEEEGEAIRSSRSVFLPPPRIVRDVLELNSTYPGMGKYQTYFNRMPFILIPAFESISGPFSMPKTKKDLEKMVEDKKLQRFHQPFEGQAVDLGVWFRSSDPFVNGEIEIVNEHYGWFLRKDYDKVKGGMPLCHEQFTDRGYNKIMCYLHLRLLGFLPIFLPTGWVIHEDGLHEKREEIEKITSREGELEEEFQAVTKGGYRGMLGPHIWVEGVCDLVTGIGWWGVVESCRRVICSRAYEPRSQVELKAIIDAKANLGVCYQDITAIQGLGAFTKRHICPEKRLRQLSIKSLIAQKDNPPSLFYRPPPERKGAGEDGRRRFERFRNREKSREKNREK